MDMRVDYSDGRMQQGVGRVVPQHFRRSSAKLMEAGVEWYHADLLRSEKTYYLPDGESHAVANAAVSRTPRATVLSVRRR